MAVVWRSNDEAKFEPPIYHGLLRAIPVVQLA
jgi:hypothetical protein